jgi:hypothetical protein
LFSTAQIAARTCFNITLYELIFLVLLCMVMTFISSDRIKKKWNNKCEIIWVSMSAVLPHLSGIQFNSFTQHYIVMFVMCFCTIFSPFSHKENDFLKKYTEYKTKVSIFTKLLSDNSPILRNIHQCVIMNLKRSMCESSDILV